MSFTAFLQMALDNILYTIPILIITVFLIMRLIKSAHMYLGAKSYVKKALKLDKKKYNGIALVDYTQKKRKKKSNSYSKLRKRAKNKCIKYFEHKLEELPVICRYQYGKLFKRSKKKVLIIVSNEKKTLKKISGKKSLKMLIEVTNKYHCLNEMILFLHNLPEALLEDQEYDIFVNEDDISITYKVK